MKKGRQERGRNDLFNGRDPLWSPPFDKTNAHTISETSKKFLRQGACCIVYESFLNWVPYNVIIEHVNNNITTKKYIDSIRHSLKYHSIGQRRTVGYVVLSIFGLHIIWNVMIYVNH